MEWEETDKGKEWTKEYHKQYYLKNKEKLNRQVRENLKRPGVKERKNALDRLRALQAKRTIYGVLGGTKCVHCGYDKDIRALQLDHINGGGRKDRDENRSTTKILKMHRDNLDSLKDKYQVLCANCNVIKKFDNNE
jgi:5-methylcytosine-specific restriction endonuclease McrA